MSPLLVAALAAAAWYAFWAIHAWYTIQGTTLQSIVIGFFLGIILGDIPRCMMIGASIQSLYLGLVMSGGNVPSDQGLAACVAIPVAVLNNLDVSTAISLALPVGLLGGVLTNVRYMICGLFVNGAEGCAERADVGGIWRNAVLFPSIAIFVMYFPVVFAAVFFGTSLMESVLAAIPAWLQNGLTVAGGALPAIGFALIIKVINQPTYIPLFLIGFFMVQYGGLGVMACAVFAICIALFVTFLQTSIEDQVKEDDFDDDFEEEEVAEKSEKLLSPADVNMFFWRWFTYCEISHCFERMQALAVCASIAPALQKMYPGEANKPQLAAALHRHLAYFNIQAIWGAAPLGVALAMEESQAMSHQMTDAEADAAINGLKTGFMGPFSGIGDVIDWGTIQVLLLGIGMSFASEGNPIGALIAALFIPITLAEGFFFANLGYRLGSEAMERLLKSGLITKLINTTGMIGMLMMGALGSSFVHISLADAGVQATLDSIIPGLLPLAVIFLLNRILDKHMDKVAWISFGIIGVSLVLSFIGIV